jgi:DNA-binding CsgD family transcriptional regulator
MFLPLADRGKVVKVGRPIDTRKRERVKKLKASGMAHIEIAEKLGLSPSGVQHYVNVLGCEKRVYRTPAAIVNRKRRCVECGKSKTPGAFKSDRNSICTVCIRGRQT